MNKAYLIVTQFTTQGYQSPEEFHTQVLMDNDLYSNDYGNAKFPVFTDKKCAQAICDQYNQEIYRYIEATVIEIDLV